MADVAVFAAIVLVILGFGCFFLILVDTIKMNREDREEE